MTQTRTMRLRGDYVLLRADGLRLLLPQRDVSATEYIETEPVPGSEPGVFEHDMPGEGRRGIVALSERMRPLREFPTERFLLTRLSCTREVSLAWNEIRVLLDTELEFHDLPAIMKGDVDVIDAYVELDGELAFCTTGARVWSEALQGRE